MLLSNIAYPNEVSGVQWSLAEHFTEALLGICATGIVGWFAKVQWDKRKLKMQHDSILYKELIELLLPSKGVVVLLRDHDFADRFQQKALSPLDDFRHQWRTVDKKFMNKGVESAGENLFKINSEFCTNYLSLQAVLVMIMGIVGWEFTILIKLYQMST